MLVQEHDQEQDNRVTEEEVDLSRVSKKESVIELPFFQEFSITEQSK
jgi:hypothetical protein